MTCGPKGTRVPLKVAGYPAHSAVRLHVIIEWDVDLSLPSKSIAEIVPQISGTALKLLWQLLANVLFLGR